MNDILQTAFLGSLVADAVAMPVHWYYDTAALDRDYGAIDGYLDPRNPHPDSILGRSHYSPRNEKAEILHDMAQYWGRKEVHYHQFLPAGDSTLNFLLAIQLYRSSVRAGRYDPDAWLDLYIELMRKPGWHRDTYVEEYHRGFFDHLAAGYAPRDCAIDDRHIGGLAQAPALVAALDALHDNDTESDVAIVREHVALTHRNRDVDAAATALVRMLHSLAEGSDMRSAIREHGNGWIGGKRLDQLATLDDRAIVGREISPACYLPESFTASLALAWKYADDFSAGILANARCGGDNCHRGAVVGSLLAAANGEVPDEWLRGLGSMERLRCDTLDPVFSQ